MGLLNGRYRFLIASGLVVGSIVASMGVVSALGNNTTVTICTTKEGALRYASNGVCKAPKETALVLGVTGPVGPAGAVGPAGVDAPQQVQIEAWSVLPRSSTERITLFQDSKVTIYGDCTNSPSSSIPSSQLFIVGVEPNDTIGLRMGYAIESTSEAGFKTVHQSGLISAAQSPWGLNTRLIDGVISTGLTHQGGYRVWLASMVDGLGRCNFRGTVQPERP